LAGHNLDIQSSAQRGWQRRSSAEPEPGGPGSKLLAAALVLTAQDPYAAHRIRMVRDQIAARGVKNQAVLKAMRETPRELFMPPAVQSLAYQDRPVPIGYGQSISQPYIVAFMSEMLNVRKEHCVLEIGTGSGYQAAILSSFAKEIYTIEIVPQLAKLASERLAQRGYKNVTVREGDGYKSWPEKAPFDRIILTAAPPELPGMLTNQLKPGGKLLAPVGVRTFAQELILVEKKRTGKSQAGPCCRCNLCRWLSRATGEAELTLQTRNQAPGIAFLSGRSNRIRTTAIKSDNPPSNAKKLERGMGALQSVTFKGGWAG
jgi:protein-L-isoaspartate(D-aspartate) O-methyltransferase